jgi:hypothetical protein
MTSPIKKPIDQLHRDKSHRAAASQFFVAGELSRRELVAVLTLGNCPTTDVLVSNKAGTRFAHVQVKTYRPGKDKTVTVGKKAEVNYGDDFFWVLAGVPEVGFSFEFYILPAADMSTLVLQDHEIWRRTPGRNNRPHSQTTSFRTVAIPPNVMKFTEKSIERYRDRWDLIVERCTERELAASLQHAREEVLNNEG